MSNATVTTALQPGTVVDYHGTMAGRQGRYIVAGVTRGRLTLISATHPADHRSALYGVRPASVTPAGDHRTLCAYCHMPAGIAMADCPNHGRHTLPCAEHAHPAPASFTPARYTA
jgi:hypothetical protein